MATTKRSYTAAREASRQGLPWRHLMPIKWHLRRHWDIYWPGYVFWAVSVAVIGWVWGIW